MFRLFNTNDIRIQKDLCGSWKMIELSQSGEPVKEYHTVVPSCFESIRGLEDFRGQCRYVKTVNCDKGDYRLVFNGVSHTANVYFDGKHIGYHYGAYTPFDIVFSVQTSGDHTLEVVADNRFSDDSTLHIPNDYRSWGGITRPLYIEKLNSAFIRYIHITPKSAENGWNLNISVQIDCVSKQDKPLSAKLTVLDKSVSFDSVDFVDGKCRLTADLFFDGVDEWCKENPTLYIARAELFEGETAIDDLNERFGFREVKVNGRDICLNGRALYLKGYNRHEDFGTFGNAVPLNAMETDLDIIVGSGANFVRTSHYPNDQRFLDLCDERGIFVWEESHARQLYAKQMQNPNFKIQAGACIDEMITNHYNHPSIIMWGLLNECESYTEIGRDAHIFHYDRIRSLDSSRPVTAAANKFFKDICHDLPDILSFNVYPQWYYEQDPKDFMQKNEEYARQQKDIDRPIIISEFGAASIYGYRAFSDVKYTEDRQAEILKNLITEFYGIDSVKGMAIWMFADARVDDEYKDWTSRPLTQNNKGVVDIYRRPKMAYYTVSELYKNMADYADEKNK